MKDTGCTLVEILIVVAIIGILAAIAIPQSVEHQDTATSPRKDTSGCVEVVIIKQYYSSQEIGKEKGYNKEWAMVENVNTKERFPIVGKFGADGDMLMIDRAKYEGKFTAE